MSKNKISHLLGRHVIKPAGFYFGDDEDEIYTLLGSCVSVTMWHPTRHIVGMCHVILPVRGSEESSLRFAGCAVKKFLEKVKYFNTSPDEYEVGVYGGGNMFPAIAKNYEKLIGVKNFKEIEKLLIASGFIIKFKDVGGEVARKLTLNRLTGSIVVEHVVMELN